MNINHTKMTLEINSCKNYEILEVRQGDKGSRIIDFTFTVNGEVVDLTSTMSAKVNATVDDVIVADSVAAVVDTKNNVVTVTLIDTILALSGICKMDIVLTEGDEIITAETVCLRVGKSVINDDSKAFPGASSIAEITKEVETARGSSSSLNARLNGIDSTVTNKAEKITVSQLSAQMQSAETSLAGKANAIDVADALKAKEDNANKVSSKTDITDSRVNFPSVEYLDAYYYKANELYSSEETDELLGNKADKSDVDTLLSSKYDSANIESGTSTLTPYSTVTDKIKNANCTYKTIGDIVIVSATVKMNAATIGANSTYPLIDLPYKCIAEDNVFCVGISNLGKVFKFAVLKNNTWLQFQTQDKTAYTFADGEQINVICSYKIK